MILLTDVTGLPIAVDESMIVVVASRVDGDRVVGANLFFELPTSDTTPRVGVQQAVDRVTEMIWQARHSGEVVEDRTGQAPR
jgi:hypothetical protein